MQTIENFLMLEARIRLLNIIVNNCKIINENCNIINNCDGHNIHNSSVLLVSKKINTHSKYIVDAMYNNNNYLKCNIKKVLLTYNFKNKEITNNNFNTILSNERFICKIVKY